MSIDTAISNFFVSLQTQASNQIFSVISLSLYAFIAIALIYLLYRSRSTKKDKLNLIKFIIGSLILAAVLEILKTFVGRLRPDLSDNDSFPSRHAALGFFVAGFLPVERKYKILLYILAALIGISRLALNLHWFSDVIAGTLIGLAFAWGIEKMPFEKMLKRIRQ